jgi:hypothetical protein
MALKRRLLAGLALSTLVLGYAARVNAQEFRGQIAGVIVDPSGARIPGAQITVTNIATNTSSNTLANDEGSYTVLYLSPGRYTVTVESPGFKKLVRQGLEVRVGDAIKLDLTLELGGAQDVVNVTAETPLLQTSTATAGQVIDQKRISELPLSDGNPFILHRLVPGVAYIGDLKFSRPFDNAGTSDIRADGAPGVNEFTLDGSPNMASGGRVAFVPPSDVVQEFKVGTASFDAQDGHSAAASVNVTMKSGTNNVHGTLYEFVRNDKLSANDFFLNRTGQPRAQLRYNRWGGTVGGPIVFPKLYNGQNKTFFFFGYEGIKDRFPEPTLETVPTDAERAGDFSALLALGTQYQIYDPLTGVREGSRVRRQPFTGNIIPATRISSIAKKYLDLYPHANTAGDSQGRNNYVSPQVRGDDFHSESYRFDHQLTDKQRMFFRYTHNSRREARGNWSGETGGIKATGNYLFRVNNGGTFDHVYTLSPTTVLNYRVGFQRFNEPNIRQHQGAFNPASLGFSSQTAALFGGVSYLPRFEIGGFSVLGDSVGGATTHNIYSFQPTLTKIVGGHQLRAGYDFRAYRENSFGLGHAAGRYDFDTTYTRGPLDNSTSAPIGQQLAAFLLGQTTGGLIDRNAARSNQTLFQGVFFQDDWKVNSRLTLNLGLRYEFEGATTERFNRNTLTFDMTAASPIEAAAKAAYALNPIPQLAPADFKVKGGYVFVTPDKPSFWNADKNNFQPRLGLAYRITDKTVLRGGWAMYTVPFVISAVRQDGFSQATSLVPTLDTGITFIANLSNPFPTGVTEPPGASQGLSTFLGRGVAFVLPNRKNGQAQRWEIGIQRELPGHWVVEGAYVGNHSYDLSVDYDFNAVPRKYLSTSPERDQATIDLLSANVTNPFAGLIPGQGLNGATTSRSQLLRPFPEFTGVTGQRNDASSNFHSAQFRAEKRFSLGYTLLASYTWSRWKSRTDFLNATDIDYDYRPDNNDVGNRLVVSGIWELPFGKGRHWGSAWNGIVDGILGGWQTQGIYQAQGGRPLRFDDNILFRGDVNSVAVSGSERTIDRWFNTAGFETTSARQLGNNIRTAPRVFPGVRGQGLDLWDLSLIKNVSITEQVKFQVRGEFLNAFNHAQFGDPSRTTTSSNFAKITGQSNLPRNVQIGLKLIF